jgi:hypothetical protein
MIPPDPRATMAGVAAQASRMPAHHAELPVLGHQIEEPRSRDGFPYLSDGRLHVLRPSSRQVLSHHR